LIICDEEGRGTVIILNNSTVLSLKGAMTFGAVLGMVQKNTYKTVG
jgi:hypothetical protein